jgi:hypothetical protein
MARCVPRMGGVPRRPWLASERLGGAEGIARRNGTSTERDHRLAPRKETRQLVCDRRHGSAFPTLLERAGSSHQAAIAAGALIGPAQVGARLMEFAIMRRAHPLVSARGCCRAAPAWRDPFRRDGRTSSRAVCFASRNRKWLADDRAGDCSARGIRTHRIRDAHGLAGSARHVPGRLQLSFYLASCLMNWANMR